MAAFVAHAGEQSDDDSAFGQVFDVTVGANDAGLDVSRVHIVQRAIRLVEQAHEHGHEFLAARIGEHHVVQRFDQALQRMQMSQQTRAAWPAGWP